MTDANRTATIVRSSSDLDPTHWMARQLPADASLRPYCEDRAVSVLTRYAQQAIESAGLTRSEVADALGTTKSYVSQVLNGSTNMTLKTLGALLWASGHQVQSLCTEPTGTVTQNTVAMPEGIAVQYASVTAVGYLPMQNFIVQNSAMQISGASTIHWNFLPSAQPAVVETGANTNILAAA